ncbi:glycosyltransferase family 2 protein [Roseibium aquae]|nr:glycosyltransferase family 2 protein [Roseibium aquae]
MEPLPEELRILSARGVSSSVLQSASKLAMDQALSASEVLVKGGYVSEDTLYSAFAESCGVPFLPLGSFRPRTINDNPLTFGHPAVGPMLMGLDNGTPVYVITPHYDHFEAVRTLLRRHPAFAGQVRVTAPAVMGHARALMNSPATDLETRYPDLSAKHRSSRNLISSFVIGGLLASALLLAPLGLWLVLFVAALSTACLTSGLVRIASARASLGSCARFDLPAAYNDPTIRWPAYTVLIPLYREMNIVPGLVYAVSRLDYPADRLQILFLLECDDLETAVALRQLDLPAHMEIVILPDGAPRTKPRALSYGLVQARGEFVTVFDAEDRPDPDQLKKAAALFSELPPYFACLQARLEIDNADDSFFSRQFALEYAGLFDQLLPWFFRRGLPFPLSGTSNHFRKDALDHVGGWDRHNVTEDADLGIRLARFRYRTGVFPSTTREEAPVRFANWFAQRARWHKGWLQTISVHIRDPRLLISELGARACLILAGFYGGSFVLTALHPVFALLVLAYGAGLLGLPAPETWVGALCLWVGGIAAAVGYGGALLAAWIAAVRTGLQPRPADLILMPVYWVFAGLAFYRSVFELVRSPYHWNKTEHGESKRRQRVA